MDGGHLAHVTPRAGVPGRVTRVRSRLMWLPIYVGSPFKYIALPALFEGNLGSSKPGGYHYSAFCVGAHAITPHAVM